MDTTLVSADRLAVLLRERPQQLLVCDCSFDLADENAGVRVFDQGHVPRAVYVHLSRQLSGPMTGRNGRHPLPERAAVARLFGELGADSSTQIVAYDAGDGLYAARLWWLARWAGHEAVAVLDGGLRAWKAAGEPLESGAAAARRPGAFPLRPALATAVDFGTLRASVESGERRVVDARSPERFRGENETLDPVGGHIPGARNRFYRDNLTDDGRFKPAAELRADFERLLDGDPPTAVISQCGSGVTACHNLLAMEVAGLSGGALYGGSWSEWCAQPGAPVATEVA